MSAPVILSVVPTNGSTDIVLGTDIEVTFDQPIDIATVTDSTFLLTGPGQTAVITPSQLIASTPTALTGREYITGTFHWDSTNTLLTFNPSKPLQPNLTYTVLAVGGGGSILQDAIANPTGELMATNYTWKFTTGDLNLTAPPVSAPLPNYKTNLDPYTIKVRPTIKVVGNDLTQEIDFIFPANLDTSTFTIQDFLVSIEPILGDVSIAIPNGLETIITATDNVVKMTIVGWPQ